MKICPFCSADNREEATVCFYCGSSLRPADTPPNPPSRTQPVHVQPRGTNPTPPATPPQPSDTQPYPYSTQSMPPQPGPTPAGYDPQAGYQPQPTYSPYPQTPQAGYTQPGYPPAGGYNPGYNQGYNPNYPPNPPPTDPYAQNGYPYSSQPTYQPQAVIPPAPPPPVTNAGPSRAWKVLALSLGAVLLCVCGLAAWTFVSAATGRATVFGSQFSTQVAQVVSGPTAETPILDPTDMPTPTPWPTFTPLPTEPPTEVPTATTAAQPTTPPDASGTPNPPPINVEKLLSPECSSALDRLNQVNEQFKSNPAAPFSQDWRSQFSQATADLKTYCGTLDSASPVPGMLKDTQQKLSQASSEFDQATKLFDEGVSQLNPAKFVEAAQHAGAAGKNLSEALAELKKIGQ